ncbi:hypothetical protein AMAG_03138 [Allomyces macrogynus ATCC 38327]|uniref:IST1-like protein n=1 Tax=Allomyces macrogynus (strain ATCC 38327) TaxID=578462 RepID=A0A0L0S4N3_ALLM3|nr:hypothetical protein AMAG_03138 [Allomyces macrogynus ATCC 38327]|eukprot:KNE57420.1 hypothetical protein AMAG_03138 [Allomyces macrogynus ATCC 38327]
MPPPMHIPGVFSANRLKVNLKLSVNRLKLLQQKKASVNAAQRKEIATLLENGKIESARVRVEHIIREDLLMEALEVIELYCELLLARFGLIESMATCDMAIQEAVHTLIYASPRVDVKELHQVRDQLAAKYGRDFANGAIENRSDVVSRRVIAKLRVQTPDVFLVNQYLNEIAKAYKVDFHIDDEPAKSDDADLGKKTARTDPTGTYTTYDASDVGFTPSREYPVDPKRVPAAAATVHPRAPSPSSQQYAGQIITVPSAVPGAPPTTYYVPAGDGTQMAVPVGHHAMQQPQPVPYPYGYAAAPPAGYYAATGMPIPAQFPATMPMPVPTPGMPYFGMPAPLPPNADTADARSEMTGVTTLNAETLSMDATGLRSEAAGAEGDKLEFPDIPTGKAAAAGSGDDSDADQSAGGPAAPAAPKVEPAASAEGPDFDELARRFEALKRRK